MRTRRIASLVVLWLAASSSASSQEAATLTLTTYDDGVSCPAGCDSHVVFSPRHNGTRNAFAPSAGSDPLANRAGAARFPCTRGARCVVCFAEPSDSCITTVYRGSGPPRGRVDATPAFMKQWCDEPMLPAAVVTECARLRGNAARLEARVNCFAEPTHSLCAAKMQTAAAAKEADAPEFMKCAMLGVRAYNAQQPDPMLHRSLAAGCAYFENRRQTNSNGDSWQKLAPGACRADHFVGPNGTDCCSADPLQSAVDFVECRFFYPQR